MNVIIYLQRPYCMSLLYWAEALWFLSALVKAPFLPCSLSHFDTIASFANYCSTCICISENSVQHCSECFLAAIAVLVELIVDCYLLSPQWIYNLITVAPSLLADLPKLPQHCESLLQFELEPTAWVLVQTS